MFLYWNVDEYNSDTVSNLTFIYNKNKYIIVGGTKKMTEYKVIKGRASWYQIQKNGKDILDIMPLKQAKEMAVIAKKNDKSSKVEVYKVTLVGRVIL